MFSETVRLLTYVTPWLALALGALVQAVAPERVRAVAWAVAIAAGSALLVAALIDGEDARARFESVIAAPIIGAWQLPWYAVGVLCARVVLRALGGGRRQS